MRIGKVVGTVTLGRSHPSFTGARLKMVEAFALADLAAGGEPRGETLVGWDQLLGAECGSLVAFSEGAEASQPFRPDVKPVDVYLAALLDHVELGLAPQPAKTK